ncbi:MAG: transketolase C-terminal domain-containing protein [Bacillota bacterium]
MAAEVARPTRAIRDAFGEALVELGAENPDVVVLDADVAHSSKTISFARKFPERFFNVGIAEGNMVCMAAGFAAAGKIPYASTFSFLITLRAGEQVRTSVAYPRLNVKLCGAYAGLSDSYDGATHQDVMDVAVMRAMPNMTVVAPADAVETRKAVFAVARYDGPVYLRLSRAEIPIVTAEDTPFELGKATLMKAGGDVTIISTGTMLAAALDAAEALGRDGIGARVLNMHTVKPLDEEAVISAARETGGIVTVEEHNILGGLGGAVAEVLAKMHPAPMEMVGIEDTFAESGEYSDLLEKYRLTAADVCDKVKKVVRRGPC